MSTLTPGRAVECFECSHITPTDDETEVCEECMSDNTAPVTVTGGLKMSEYPEHDKLSTISERSQSIGEFLEWLRADQGIHLMRWQLLDDQRPCPVFDCEKGRILSLGTGRDKGECGRCNGTGWVPDERETWVTERRGTNALLAEFFGIDQGRLEQEKRAMLAAFKAS